MKNIIVVGYPKSGNTWLSRLTAELVNCPIEGFLYNDHQEIAKEGSHRLSEFLLYKSHHQYHELTEADIECSKIIYVIRDPRDISISGRNFFSFKEGIFLDIDWKKEGFTFEVTNFFKSLINRVYQKSFKLIIGRKQMNKAILYGNKDVHHWCRISWKAHLTPFIENSNILKVQYESVLVDPLTESKRILDFIGMEKDEEEINMIIDNQSFDKRKQLFKKEKQISQAKFLRKGKRQQWKTVFSNEENKMFVDLLKKELTEFEYDLEK